MMVTTMTTTMTTGRHMFCLRSIHLFIYSLSLNLAFSLPLFVCLSVSLSLSLFIFLSHYIHTYTTHTQHIHNTYTFTCRRSGLVRQRDIHIRSHSYTSIHIVPSFPTRSHDNICNHIHYPEHRLPCAGRQRATSRSLSLSHTHPSVLHLCQSVECVHVCESNTSLS